MNNYRRNTQLYKLCTIFVHRKNSFVLHVLIDMMEDNYSAYIRGNRGNSLINQRLILKILGVLLFIEGLVFLACAGVGLLYGEKDYIYFIYSLLATLGVGALFLFLGKGAENKLTRRDSYCIVTFTWLLFSCFGAMPFWLSGEVDNITDAFFETMSGFTTTGASVLNNIESLSHGMLFWRSLTQWIGGMGIVFFTIAVLPIFGVGNQTLFSAEATGVMHDKIHPKISVMAKQLWSVYLILTVTETALLLLGGMNLFDAVCHSFSTTGTGGYSTKQASVAYWNSPFIEYVIAVFMVLSGVSYSLYFMCLKGRFKNLLKDDEIKWFFTSVGVITLLITVSLVYHNHYGVEEAFRKAFFQVASVHTSTGFATDDYNLWAPYTWLFIIYAMLMGGCTGSTVGGIKGIRFVIVMRNIKNEFSRLIHPRAVLPVKANGQALSSALISTVSTFILLYFTCLFIGWFVLMVMGIGMIEAFALSVSSLGNVGPALGAFGPEYSWDALPNAAKWFTSFLMLIGRLEIFGVLVMLAPSFWHKR